MKNQISSKRENSLDKSKFKKLDKYIERIYLDFDLQNHFSYKYHRINFQYSFAIQRFLKSNKEINLYLTNNEEIENFVQYGNDWLVNIDDLIKFCNKIGYSRRDKKRIAAFFGQHISISNLSTSDDDRIEFLKTSATEKDLLIGIRSLPKESKEILINAMFSIEDSRIELDNKEPIVSSSEFIEIFTKFLTDRSIQNAFFDKIPEIQIKVLEELKKFLTNNLDKNESFIQDWIDEDNGKYRKTRCLIFGIQYVDPLREGEIMGRKRFDILATQNRENHIIIELKSPSGKVFDIKEKKNSNGGKTTEYSLSRDLSRAIPQILGYKRFYEDMSPEKVEEIGIKEKKNVSDCVIVIGKRENSVTWKQNFKSLQDNLQVKIWTYTDLIDRMQNTIKNLKENLT